MNLFSYIKTQLPILDVVQEYATLKRAGIYWKGTCPFHHEKTASFTISPHKEIFYCFGCHAGGDVITFMAKIEHCTPLEAARHLIDRYKLVIPASLLESKNLSATPERSRYFELCSTVAAWCHEQLQKNSSAKQYLLRRGINKDSIEQFNLGYFPGGLQAVQQCIAATKKQHFLPADLIQAHILFQGKTVLYSPFEERIIFPIKDYLGRSCGFGGRIFKEQDTRAKYYNSKENEFFVKGSLLFGLDSAKKSIQEQETAFLVEGYTDCIAMVQHGIPNSVATLGTACTLEHLKQIARYAQRLYVVYDSDTAGQEAILRMAEICWQATVDLWIIPLPAKEDPASFLQKGGDIQKCIKQAQDIVAFFISVTGSAGSNSLADKVQIARKIIEIIKKITDPLKQDILLQKASKTLDMPLHSLQQELQRNPEKTRREPLVQPTNTRHFFETPPPEGDKLEKKIFFAIMNNVKLLDENIKEHLISYFPASLSTLTHQLFETKTHNPSLDFIQFFDILSEKDKQCVSKIMVEFSEIPTQDEFEHLVIQLQKKNWKKIVHDTKNALAHARTQGDEKKVATILQDFLMLKKKMVHKDLI